MISRKYKDLRGKGELTVANEYFKDVSYHDIFTVDITHDNGIITRHTDCPVIRIENDQFTLRVMI